MVTARTRRRRGNNMGKAKAERALKDNEAKAVARTLRVSPQKLNLVAQMIRGFTRFAKLRSTRSAIGLSARRVLSVSTSMPMPAM